MSWILWNFLRCVVELLQLSGGLGVFGEVWYKVCGFGRIFAFCGTDFNSFLFFVYLFGRIFCRFGVNWVEFRHNGCGFGVCFVDALWIWLNFCRCFLDLEKIGDIS